MTNTDRFFDSSDFTVVELETNLKIQADTPFTKHFVILDAIRGGTASAISSTLKYTQGRDSVVVASSPVWRAPAAIAPEVPLVPNDNDLTFKIFIYNPVGTFSGPSVINVDTQSEAYYIILAIDETGAPLEEQPIGTINVQFENLGTTINDNYAVSTTTPTIGVPFYSKAVSAGETFKVYITGSYSEEAEYENGTTFTDDYIITTIRETTGTEGSLIWQLSDTIPAAGWDGKQSLVLIISLTAPDNTVREIPFTLTGGAK